MLIIPARCTGDLPEDLDQAHLVSQPKLDGSRYVLYLGCDPYERRDGNALLSRRVSTIDGKHVDRTPNLPHITGEAYPDLQGTVLDGEAFLTDFPSTQSVMGSSPALAVSKQESNGWLTYYAFDCPVYRGKDIRGLPLEQRRKVLEAVVAKMGNGHVRAVPQWTGDATCHFHRVVEAGGEGVIVKDLRMGYGVGWSKYKKSYEVSCFISGFKPGNGKYAGGIGALALSVYEDDGTPREVGFASGFDDATRALVSAAPKAFMGRVVDIHAQELSKDGRLRHPTFMRFRIDLDETDCTLTKLRDDLARKAKSHRWKDSL